MTAALDWLQREMGAKRIYSAVPTDIALRAIDRALRSATRPAVEKINAQLRAGLVVKVPDYRTGMIVGLGPHPDLPGFVQVSVPGLIPTLWWIDPAVLLFPSEIADPDQAEYDSGRAQAKQSQEH